MYKLVVLLFVTIFVAIHAAPTDFNDDLKAADPIVTLPHGGQLRGKQKSISLTRKYSSFKGVRYALAPVGNLRLKPPVAHPGWNGIENATEHGESCIGPGFVTGTQGSEDCLFLNVYSTKLDPKAKLPVMFWIHGGSYASGSGNSFVYGPEYLIDEDVIVVTVNYRLGFLGFFSTNDKNAAGNYGLKDLVESLRWVQTNIEVFGGDPNHVTIFGESAGGCLVHYLVLSQMAKGLFHGAIAQSGTALNPWAFQDNPREIAFEMAKLLNISATTTEGIVKEIQGITDPMEFAKITPTATQLEVPRGNAPFYFAPTIEPEDAEEERFLTNHPLTIMKQGSFNHVPFILGSTDTEGLYAIREITIDPVIFEKLNSNPNLLLPYEWYIQPNSAAAVDIVQHIREMYFHNNPIADKLDYVKYVTDRHFEYAIYKTAQMHAANQDEPVFYYIFSFDGILNYIKKLLLLNSYDGAMHADDLGYLWKMAYAPSPALPGSSAAITKSRMLRMWTNFAKKQDPTPIVDELITTKWPKVQGEQEFMDIGKNLVPSKNPFGDRMKMWRDLDSKYN